MSLPDGTCPGCAFKAPLEAFLGDTDAADVLRAVADMPGPPTLRRAMLRYLGLHAAPGRKVSWRRGAALLAEIVPMMIEGRISRQGRIWPAPADYWQHALEVIFEKPDLNPPIKGNGLLLQIIANHAASAEARSERQTEDRRAGNTPVGGVAASPSPQPSPLKGEGAKPEPPRARPETIAAGLAAAKSLIGGKA